MGQILIKAYPVEVILEHNDVVVDVVIDDTGSNDVFEIDKIYWTEQAGLSWTAYVEHPTTGKFVEQSISSFENSSKNIPPPARFNSYPFILQCSLVRA